MHGGNAIDPAQLGEAEPFRGMAAGMGMDAGVLAPGGSHRVRGFRFTACCRKHRELQSVNTKPGQKRDVNVMNFFYAGCWLRARSGVRPSATLGDSGYARAGPSHRSRAGENTSRITVIARPCGRSGNADSRRDQWSQIAPPTRTPGPGPVHPPPGTTRRDRRSGCARSAAPDP